MSEPQILDRTLIRAIKRAVEVMHFHRANMKPYNRKEALIDAIAEVRPSVHRKIGQAFDTALSTFHESENTAILQDKYWEGKQRGADMFSDLLKRELGLDSEA